MSTEETSRIFSQVIERELSFLREMGFTFTGATEEVSAALGISLTGAYTNAKANRAVRVVYIPKQNGPGEVTITRIELVVPEPLDPFDYTSLGSMEVCATVHSDVTGDFLIRLEHHLRASEKALKDKFVPVLVGGAWQSDHLDWGGMK